MVLSLHGAIPPIRYLMARDAAPPTWRPIMFRSNAITLALNTILAGPLGLHLSHSGYIIASS